MTPQNTILHESTTHNILCLMNCFLWSLYLHFCISIKLLNKAVEKPVYYHYYYDCLPAAIYISNVVERSFLPIIRRQFFHVFQSNLSCNISHFLNINTISSPVSNFDSWCSTKKRLNFILWSFPKYFWMSLFISFSILL